jgi:hypothetical protein
VETPFSMYGCAGSIIHHSPLARETTT